jgi:hypothetical protein
MYKAFVEKFLDACDLAKYKCYYIYFSVFSPNTEKSKCLYFMGKHFATNYPYDYYFEYLNKDVEYGYDATLELPYVIHNNRKLYFKDMPKNKVLEAYRMLLLEQDIRSPHCYVNTYEELKGKTILDVGAAEGIFSLNAIDFAAHIYLFECEIDWIKPLRATFKPMKDKVSIVEKYVSNKSEGNYVTLDDFFIDKKIDNLFVKMDIEGFERKALNGSEILFDRTNDISGAICAYHRDDDEKVITSFLNRKKCNFSKTSGYIYNERCLRTGVIRYSKSKIK